MGEIIEFKTIQKKQKTQYNMQRFNNILMDKTLAETLSETIMSHLKTSSSEIDKDRVDFILQDIKKYINKKYY